MTLTDDQRLRLECACIVSRGRALTATEIVREAAILEEYVRSVGASSGDGDDPEDMPVDEGEESVEAVSNVIEFMPLTDLKSMRFMLES